ncbi:MAG: DnaJ domain-containing protein, partial [Betaproteobacteria bacterium]|nr:DnaJ domain-containing protein [Betaproteobacteria bacterium]
MDDSRLYEILGVNEYSTRADIVSAYRKLAMEWHPDRNSAAGAERKFKEIQNAYRVLLPRHKPRSLHGLWEEVMGEKAADEPEESASFADNFPFLAAVCLLAGGGFLA